MGQTNIASSIPQWSGARPLIPSQHARLALFESCEPGHARVRSFRVSTRASRSLESRIESCTVLARTVIMSLIEPRSTPGTLDILVGRAGCSLSTELLVRNQPTESG